MKNFIRFCCVVVFSIFTITTYAQKIEGFGKVLDKETNSPLPGATIVIKDSSNGVTSDFDGNFKIKSSLGDVLVVSYIGYNSIEVVVVESEMIILMEPDLAELEEVTISVGYFDVSKKDLSGSISQINTEQLEKNRGSSLENLLQGQVAGVVINESSEPGGGVGISIRGTNSILGGTQPLYVLDGIPISPISDAEGNTTSGNAQTSMNFINPNDIEKIEILKVKDHIYIPHLIAAV